MSAFDELVSKEDLQINLGLNSATEATMLSVLGPPKGTLTTEENNTLVSGTVFRLLETENVGPFSAHGIRPALESLRIIFTNVQTQKSELFKVLGYGGMLSVRLRRLTVGISKEISNHTWGTALDVKIDGRLDLNPDGRLTRGIAELIPYFNAQGWFSGVGFATAEDDSHFEVAEETIRAWDAEHKFDVDGLNLSAPNLESSVSDAKALLIDAMNNAGLKDPTLRAGIAAIAEAESGFRPRSEVGYGNTCVPSIRRIFGNRVAGLSDDELTALRKDDKKFFDKVYGGSWGLRELGNTEEGDGFRFRGRGIFQITGRHNYQKYGDQLHIPIVNNPDLANDPKIAAQLAVAYMQDHKVGDDFEKMKRAVGPRTSPDAEAKKDRLFAEDLRTGAFA